MSEGHDAGPTVIVVAPGEETQIVGEGGGEVQAEVLAEAVEPVADAAVEIAAIEADRDVTLAVIQQEGDAAFADRLHSEELQSCRTRIAELEGELEALRNPAPLTLVALPEPPPSPPEPEPESAAEDPQEAAEDAPAPEPEKAKRKPHRWI